MSHSLSRESTAEPGVAKVLSFFEFWPAWLFYLPVYIYVFFLMLRYRGLMLPTAVNPQLANGQFVGESKDEILNLISKYLPEYSVKHFLIEKHLTNDDDLLIHAEQLLQQYGFTYPFVAKPDLGCRGAGVNLIKNKEEFAGYLNAFPSGNALICQELIPYESEAGVFYCRLPHEEKGRIISLTLKYFPFVKGDGISTLKALIENDPRAGQLTNIYFPRLQNRLDSIPANGKKVSLVFAGNHSKGAIFKNGHQFITAQLNETFDRISKKLPEFYFGRFDIRYENFSKLEQGLNFKIVEINGASAESTHIWDSDYSLLNAWRDLFKQFHLAFMIGAFNRNKGVKTQSFKDFYAAYLRDKQLSKQYPGTH